jgi:2-polyprenyl-3-methyl-5-hydroxy-6-metoxy-1,4-benzoquinol methylase
MEPCQVCGALNLADYVVRPDTHYVRCCACGLVFNANAEELLEAASRHYDDAEYFRFYSARFPRKVAGARRRLDLIQSYVSGGRLLDIGCGLGETLVAAREAGFDAEGLDLGAHPVKHCRGLGFVMHQASITDTGLPEASFDVITMWDVLEHIPRSADGLAEVARILRPGGIAAIVVPSGEYLKAHLLRNSYQNYRGLWARTHFVYHNSRTLRRVVREHGLEPMPMPVLWCGALRRGPAAAAGELAAALPRWLATELRTRLRLTRNIFMVARKPENGPGVTSRS